jgi:hypothetical protein
MKNQYTNEYFVKMIDSVTSGDADLIGEIAEHLTDLSTSGELANLTYAELDDVVINIINHNFEIIGYYQSMKYLMEHDNTLKESTALLGDCFEISSLNSELLANTHNQARLYENMPDIELIIGAITSM